MSNQVSEKDAYYFKHDANARHDPKIEALKTLHGMEGYGRFWVLIELLREQSHYCLPVDRFLLPTLARQWMCEKEEAEEFLEDLAEIRLVKKSDSILYSESLRNRMQAWEQKKKERSENARKAAKARWQSDSEAQAEDKQTDSNAEAMRPHSGSNAKKSIEEDKESREENRREEVEDPFQANVEAGFVALQENSGRMSVLQDLAKQKHADLGAVMVEAKSFMVNHPDRYQPRFENNTPIVVVGKVLNSFLKNWTAADTAKNNAGSAGGVDLDDPEAAALMRQMKAEGVQVDE